MTWFEIFVSLTTLTILEIILGIDNLVFLAILSERLPPNLRKKARKIGLTLAWMMRLALLASAIWLTKLTKPWFTIFGVGFSGRDIFLIFGGLFLLAKSTQEIHSEFDPKKEAEITPEIQKKAKAAFFWIISQIVVLDMVFSLDSVLTAIGLTQNFLLMAIAITIAIITMIFASEPMSRFIHRHPTIKMLALSFLLLIGTFLIADGLGYHIPRGYLYFAMAFSLLVESLNMWRSKRRT
jgi:predicted tellurium resistance membrane protein TerC